MGTHIVYPERCELIYYSFPPELIRKSFMYRLKFSHAGCDAGKMPEPWLLKSSHIFVIPFHSSGSSPRPFDFTTLGVDVVATRNPRRHSCTSKS